MILNFNQLYYFYVVAREGGIVRAAKTLNISQPALSAQIRTFERAIGKKVLVKVGRGLQLSADGRLIYGYARKMFDLSSALVRALNMEEKGASSPIHFSVSNEVERPFAADLISRLMTWSDSKNLPISSVSLISDTHETLSDGLRSLRYDILLSNYAINSEEIYLVSQEHLPVVAVASRKFLTRHKSLKNQKSLHTILGQRDIGIVIPTIDHKLRTEIDIYFERQSLKPKVIFESNIIASVIRAACDGIGVGFFPKPYIERELRMGQLEPLTRGTLWSHNLYLHCASGHETEDRIQMTADLLKEMCHK